jgi:hypothetical protein
MREFSLALVLGAVLGISIPSIFFYNRVFVTQNMDGTTKTQEPETLSRQTAQPENREELKLISPELGLSVPKKVTLEGRSSEKFVLAIIDKNEELLVPTKEGSFSIEIDKASPVTIVDIVNSKNDLNFELLSSEKSVGQKTIAGVVTEISDTSIVVKDSQGVIQTLTKDGSTVIVRGEQKADPSVGDTVHIITNTESTYAREIVLSNNLPNDTFSLLIGTIDSVEKSVANFKKDGESEIIKLTSDIGMHGVNLDLVVRKRTRYIDGDKGKVAYALLNNSTKKVKSVYIFDK